MIIRVIKEPPPGWSLEAIERFPVGELVEVCKIEQPAKTAHVWIDPRYQIGTFYIPEDCYELVFDI